MLTAAYDVIVAGVGGMGSATVYHLARRGKRVLGLERFDIPHDHGSSHGLTRIIRLAYFEDPTYVPLLRRAYELWWELGTEAGEQLLYTTGILEAGERIYEGALAHGATVRARERVLAWEATNGGIRVETDRGEVEAEQLVLTAGAWSQNV